MFVFFFPFPTNKWISSEQIYKTQAPTTESSQVFLAGVNVLEDYHKARLKCLFYRYFQILIKWMFGKNYKRIWKFSSLYF